MVAIVVSLLLALSMTPAFDAQSALADEPAERPATTGGDVPLEGPAENTGLGVDGNAEEADGPVTATVREDGSLVANGLIYKSEGDGTTLIGFEDGASLEREVSVPEKLTDGALEYAVRGVDVAEGQSAPGVLSLELPQTIEDVNTKSLAAAMPALARVSVDGRGGAYSSANGMLFKQESIQASSDGSTTRIANRELVWAPPAMVIARIPGTCKTVAPGAFTDDRALETVMVFSIVDSVAKAEKDEGGNTTKEGAFTDEQVSKVNIVTPMETVVSSEGERINTDAFLSEDAPLDEKHTPWCDCGFSMERFTVGIPYGSTSLAVAVPEDGKVGTPEITIGHYTDHPEWDPKGDTGEPQSGLVFEYKADMTVSVSWKGDKAAVPSHLELPAYVVENGVKTAVTEVAPSAFEGATQLESVVVPEGITTIGESAFAGCSNIVDASLPSTLGTLGPSSFENSGVGSGGSNRDATALGVSAATGGAVSESASAMSRSAELPELASGSFGGLAVEQNSALSSYSLVSVRDSDYEWFYCRRIVNDQIYTNSLFSSVTSSDSSLTARLDDPNTLYVSIGDNTITSLCIFSDLRFDKIYIEGMTDARTRLGHVTVTLSVPVIIAGLRNQSAHGTYMMLNPISQLPVSWSYLIDKPASFTPSAHNHDASHIATGTLAATRIPSLDASKIGSGTFGTTRLADAAVTAAKLGASAVETAKIKDSAVTSAKIANGTVAAADLADGAVTNAKLAANAVGSSNIADGAVAAADLADNAVTSAKIANGNVTTDDLANNAVTSAKIVDGAIATADLANGAVANAKIADKNVTTAKLADGAVTNDKIANSTIDDSKLKSTFLKAKDIEGKADVSTVTNLATTVDNLDKATVKTSDFGSITYNGLDGASSKAVMPTSYKKGFTPALPAPEKAGCEFAGWTWGSQTEPTTDVAGAFAGGGDVTLTANWAVPKASYFFTGDDPFASTNTGEQQSVIAVKLSESSGKRLTSVSFANDNAELVPASASVTFTVSGSQDMSGAITATGWDKAATGDVALAELPGGGYGVYVRVALAGDAVNADAVTKSYADGSYVAKFAKLNYVLA